MTQLEASAVMSAPDGQSITTASRDKTARVWTIDGTLEAVLAGHAGVVWPAEFSADGRRVITAPFDRTSRPW